MQNDISSLPQDESWSPAPNHATRHVIWQLFGGLRPPSSALEWGGSVLFALLFRRFSVQGGLLFFLYLLRNLHEVSSEVRRNQYEPYRHLEVFQSLAQKSKSLVIPESLKLGRSQMFAKVIGCSEISLEILGRP